MTGEDRESNGLERVEEITVTCPFCPSKDHTYPIEIETGLIMFFEFPGEREPEPRTFTRIFICPDSGRKFQGEMTLMQRFDRPIESVTVKRAKGLEG